MNIDSILEKQMNSNDNMHEPFVLTYSDAKQAIKEIVEKTLELAAENAKIKKQSEAKRFQDTIVVDKQSILSQIENIKF